MPAGQMRGDPTLSSISSISESSPEDKLRKAILYLAGRCDGARKRDGAGFNKYDAERGHALAEKLGAGEDLTRQEVRIAQRMLGKYRRQLAEAGIDVEDILAPGAGGADTEVGKQTQGARLIELVHEADVRLFHTPDGEPWAFLPVQSDDDLHLESWPIRSKPFRRWLCGRFYNEVGKPPGAQAVQDALAVIEGEAAFDSPVAPVFTRVAPLEKHIVLDLGSANWQQVEIAPDGWHVSLGFTPKRAFRRGRSLAPLPTPERGGNLRELRQFLNVASEHDWILVVAWLVAAFRPTGPYPALALTGEQGSGKSTTARVLRALLDPSKAPLRTIPRDERDLMITATHNWVIAFDNLSGIPIWLSDALSRLATGGGLATRELYENEQEFILEATRPVIVNGIDDLIVRYDLLDRAVLVACPPITEESRRPEEEFWREFEEARPRILGALLDAVCEGLRNIENVKLSRLPRMADFAKWVVACEPALPWAAGAFMEAYAGNRAEAVDLALEADVVATAIRKLLAEHDIWRGTATELLEVLADHITEKQRNSKVWPKTPHTLAGRVRRAATFLRTVGVEVEFGREGKRGTRTIILRQRKQRTVSTVSEPTNDLLEAISLADDEADAKRQADASADSASAPASALRTCSECMADATDEADDVWSTLSSGEDDEEVF